MTRGHLLVDTAPAGCWEDAFPVGNGRHGALAPGQPGAEPVIVTHSLLTWPDAPDAPDGPPELAGRLDEVRDLLLAGKPRRALARFGGDWPRRHPRPFHPAFAVRLTENRPDGRLPAGYRRTLSYRAGVAVTRWPGRRTAWFASRVRDVVVRHASGDAAWDTRVTVDPWLPGAPRGLRVTTELRQLADSDVAIVLTVEYPRPAHEAGGAGGLGGYAGAVRVTFPGASAAPEWRGVLVTGCRELTLLARVEPFDAAAAGAGAGASREAARDRALAAVSAMPCEPRLLLAEHARAHAAALGDVGLELCVSAAERRLPVGELLDRQAGCPDVPLPALLEKLFDSGRYLLLSASGPLPPRLTGIWQGDWNPAWSGAITTDANLGLQLAGAVVTDVPAAVDAVANLIARQLDDWRANARRLFGARGIVAPAHTDGVSGRTTHFEPRWPLHAWTAAADWLLVPLLDEALARGDAGPPVARAALVAEALGELAAFYEDFLIRRDGDGRVIFAPSYSPENAPRGWPPLALNATMDIAAARHALRAATRACGPAHPAAGTWAELLGRLPAYRLTGDGALAEWACPPAGSGEPPLPGDDDHRHVSHLYPVWPLHEITVADTPVLAAAALRSLRARGAQDDSAHGYLHKALAAARLRDAGLAGRLLAALCGQAFFFRSLMSSHYPKQSVYNADAACALPGLLAEMLVDSVPGGEAGQGRVELLPALPAFLPRGRVRGLRTLTGARVVSLRWDAGAGTAEAVLLSAAGCEVDVGCAGAGRLRRVRLPGGEPVRLSWDDCWAGPSQKEVADDDAR